jgi:hypothetical protein
MCEEAKEGESNENKLSVWSDSNKRFSKVQKRRNTTYRDVRYVTESSLSKESLEKEKKFLKDQYSFAPSSDNFRISYVSTLRNKK